MKRFHFFNNLLELAIDDGQRELEKFPVPARAGLITTELLLAPDELVIREYGATDRTRRAP